MQGFIHCLIPTGQLACDAHYVITEYRMNKELYSCSFLPSLLSSPESTPTDHSYLVLSLSLKAFPRLPVFQGLNTRHTKQQRHACDSWCPINVTTLSKTRITKVDLWPCFKCPPLHFSIFLGPSLMSCCFLSFCPTRHCLFSLKLIRFLKDYL